LLSLFVDVLRRFGNGLPPRSLRRLVADGDVVGGVTRDVFVGVFFAFVVVGLLVKFIYVFGETSFYRCKNGYEIFL
jgi:hypothetical protein